MDIFYLNVISVAVISYFQSVFAEISTLCVSYLQREERT